MYSALGYGKGDTILACFAIAVGVPAYVHYLRGDMLLLMTSQALPLLDLRRAHTECEPLCQEVKLHIMCGAADYNTQVTTWPSHKKDVRSLDRCAERVVPQSRPIPSVSPCQLTFCEPIEFSGEALGAP